MAMFSYIFGEKNVLEAKNLRAQRHRNGIVGAYVLISIKENYQ